MIVELSAVRLIAPWFGTSLVVWSNVIAVVLLGLSLGYLFGARFSRGEDPVRVLRWALGLAVVWVALIPFLTPLVGNALTPDQLNLDRALAVFRWGGMAAAGLLFLGPAIVLGCVGPLVTEALGRGRGLNPGDAGGRVLFGSTLGSLVGVFLTSWWLIPVWGLKGTYFAAALGLVLGLVVSFGAWRGGLRAPLGLALLGLAGLLLPSEGRAAAEGTLVLEVRESPYQRVRVVESGGMRFLEVNEASNSYQSAWQPEPGLIRGNFYYNDFVLPYWWSTGRPAARPYRVLCIGLGAGTAKRVIEGSVPSDVQFVGVELDPVVVELARQYCELEEGPGDRVIAGLDGRVALAGVQGPFDQIIVDAYANQFELPPHLVTEEFFASLKPLLAEDGWVQLNVGGSEPSAPLPRAVAGALMSALETSVLTMQIPGTHNQIITATLGAGLPDPTGPGFRPAGLPADVAAWLQGRDVRGQWAWLRPGNPVDVHLTDNHAPIEELLFEDL